MPPISHRTLVIVNIIAALWGLWLLDASPKTAILILGISLATALIDGWWYLFPIRYRWWYPLLIGLIGINQWTHPRGWFFMAWAAIELGTGLRAESTYRKFLKARAEEQARQERLAELGLGEAPAEDSAGDGDPKP